MATARLAEDAQAPGRGSSDELELSEVGKHGLRGSLMWLQIKLAPEHELERDVRNVLVACIAHATRR